MALILLKQEMQRSSGLRSFSLEWHWKESYV